VVRIFITINSQKAQMIDEVPTAPYFPQVNHHPWQVNPFYVSKEALFAGSAIKVSFLALLSDPL
jgi:hypothetical protein